MAQRKSWASYVIWGSIAVCAVLAAAFTIAVVVGAHRGIQFASLPKRAAPQPAAERPTTIAPPPAVTERDFARVNDALRDLAAERDRLVVRVEQLERAVGDITASIKERAEAVSQPPPEEKPAPEASPKQISETPPPVRGPERVAPALGPQPPATTGSINPAARTGRPLSDPMGVFRPYVVMQESAPAPAVAPWPAATQAPMQILPKQIDASSSNAATRTEFAIDLGSESTIDALRILWNGLRGVHATLNGLRPLVSIRDGARPGTTELRLIAGPFSNAGAAARACAALQSKGANCQTAVFDGQRLALR
jgi:hypothetical protein